MTDPIWFYCVGAPRSGTTWLFKALSEHPEVCVPAGKYSGFFGENYRRGLNWYKRLFKSKKDTVRAFGDFGVTDMCDRTALKRIKDQFPNIKILFCARDPSDRDRSNFLFLKRNQDNYRDGIIDELRVGDPQISEASFYGRNLSRVYEYFNPENVMIIIYDDLKKDPDHTFVSVCKFLGIQENFKVENIRGRVYGAALARNKVAASLVKAGARLVRKIGLPGLVGFIKNRSPVVMNALYKQVDSTTYELSDEERKYIRDRYREDLKLFSRMVDRDFTHWNR